MGYFKFILITVLIITSLNLTASAQIDWGKQANTTLNGMVDTLRWKILTNNADLQSQQRQAQIGQEKIRDGKATTRFASDPQITQQWIKSYLSNSTDSIQVQEQTASYLTDVVVRFKQLLRQKGMSPNDVADAQTIAFVTAYEFYTNEKLSITMLQTVRKQIQTDLLKSPQFQGRSDQDKQVLFERYAVYALDPVDLRAKGAAADILRKKLAIVLSELSGVQADQVLITESGVFGDRGERNIRTGSAGTSYNRTDTMLTAGEFARSSGKNGEYFVELLKKFDAETKRRGGQINDLAWATAIAAAIAYEAYSEGKVKLNNQQFRWLLEEARKDIINNKTLQAMSDENKQITFEKFVIKTMLIDEEFQEYLRTPSGGFKYIFKETNPVYKAQNLLVDIFAPRNFYDYELTSTGFVKKQFKVQ